MKPTPTNDLTWVGDERVQIACRAEGGVAPSGSGGILRSDACS